MSTPVASSRADGIDSAAVWATARCRGGAPVLGTAVGDAADDEPNHATLGDMLGAGGLTTWGSQPVAEASSHLEGVFDFNRICFYWGLRKGLRRCATSAQHVKGLCGSVAAEADAVDGVGRAEATATCALPVGGTRV